MASLVHRCIPSHGIGRKSCRARTPATGSPTRDCRVSAGYKARVASPDMEETKEYKIARLAEILGTSPEHVSGIVKLRPGLLVVPNGDMSFYEQRVFMLARRHGVDPRQAANWVLEQPDLLFQRV
ncbi:hypothetical protein GPECTOR_11g10 [Gonium pectorale]|uniref:Uncharacterized protein n=1 Tax=Gonium pectorale TaxID=33097 RepID=A0A150GPC4_GONPE|nr:hypothetical protein GPECTOR_11g10 [Gonium pectorale]|eukprot:KXZ51645.1 hypothetical protein GPECTOR_11g10 [Gonium pectorale]